MEFSQTGWRSFTSFLFQQLFKLGSILLNYGISVVSVKGISNWTNIWYIFRVAKSSQGREVGNHHSIWWTMIYPPLLTLLPQSTWSQFDNIFSSRHSESALVAVSLLHLANFEDTLEDSWHSLDLRCIRWLLLKFRQQCRRASHLLTRRLKQLSRH